MPSTVAVLRSREKICGRLKARRGLGEEERAFMPAEPFLGSDSSFRKLLMFPK